MSGGLGMRAALSLALALSLAPACGDDDDGVGASNTRPGSVGVAQGGAQDFGAFRALLDAGEIPGPGSLDSLGFFNEHKIQLPEPQCGHDVCVHGLLGTMGNMITGAGCTLLVIGMNTPLDPSAISRAPLDLTLVIDTSGSMVGVPIARVREGLMRMLSALQPDDRVSLVTFDDHAEVRAEALAPEALSSVISQLGAAGSTNLYDGLRTGYDLAAARLDPEREARVVLLSDGEPTAGLEASARVLALARSYAGRGVGLTTIGLGEEFDPLLMRSLAEAGAGSFYFVEDVDAVREVFSEEVRVSLVPLARRGLIDLYMRAGYELRALYGARLFSLDATRAEIELPTLQIARRTDASGEDPSGRRGGGGVMLAELVATGEDPESVAALELAYDDPSSGERVTQNVEVRSPVDPEDALEDGYFDAPSVEKAFVALNVYAALDIATQSAAAGDYGTGVVTLLALGDSVERWLRDNPDADIEDDLESVERLRALLEDQAERVVRPVHPPEPWPRD